MIVQRAAHNEKVVRQVPVFHNIRAHLPFPQKREGHVPAVSYDMDEFCFVKNSVDKRDAKGVGRCFVNNDFPF